MLRDQLIAPARRSARSVAISRLGVVRAAYDGLDGDSSDAIHDLRVALRRLRSWIRAYRRQLDDTLRKKTRRRLNKLARETDGARDTEVFVSWIEQQNDIPLRALGGTTFIARHLAKDRTDAMRKMRKALDDRLPETLDAMEAQFARYGHRLDVDSDRREDTMASITADLIRQHQRQFRRRLSRIESGDDSTQIHQARIATKRLRYLLEWLDEFAGIAVLCKQLSELQDLLGACHDSDVFIEHLFGEIADIGAADAKRRAKRALGLAPDDVDLLPPLIRVRPGIIELASRSRREHDDAFQKFQETWTPATLDSVSSTIDGLVTELESI